MRIKVILPNTTEKYNSTLIIIWFNGSKTTNYFYNKEKTFYITVISCAYQQNNVRIP